VAQASGKGEEAAEQLRHLTPVCEGAEGDGEDGGDAQAQLGGVEKLDVEDGGGPQTVGAQQVDEVGGREVQVDVLEHQEGGEEQAAGQEGGFLARENERKDEETVEEAVVLEVDVVNDQQAGGEEDGEGGGAGGTLGGGRGGVDVAVDITSAVASWWEGASLQIQRVDQDELGEDDGGALEVDGAPAVIFEVVHLEHLGVDEARELRQEPLEVGEEGRVVQGPFRGALVVPFARGQAVCDGEPVPVDFEVGGFAGLVSCGGALGMRV